MGVPHLVGRVILYDTRGTNARRQNLISGAATPGEHLGIYHRPVYAVG